MKLASIIEEGIREVNSQRSSQSLGDRSSYIGASDLGQCPRKVVLGKVSKEDHDISTLLRFERGHLSEDVLDNALRAKGFVCERQTTLEGETPNGTPLKFHLDFVVNGGNRFAVLEAKSTSPVPASPYEGWEMQLQAQLSLAKELYPNAKVEGTIFALDMAPKGGSLPYGIWNGYTSNPDLWKGLQEDADMIYGAVQEYKASGNLPDLPRRPGPLCGFCSGLQDCPSFQGERLESLSSLVANLVALQGQKKHLSQLEDDCKRDLKEILRQRDGWVSVHLPEEGKDRKLKVIQKSSTKLDFNGLNNFLSQHGADLEDFRTRSTREELILK